MKAPRLLSTSSFRTSMSGRYTLLLDSLMKDDFLLALSDGIFDDPDDTAAASAAAASVAFSTPSSREAVLARVGPVKTSVYQFVRECIDDFERIAPWRPLYYPPEDPAELVTLVGSLLDFIRGIPKRVEALLATIPAGEGSGEEPGREDVGFLFNGLHRMVAHELKRIDTNLAPFRGGSAVPSTVEGQLLCELCADLKGKYTSALMGSAASLVGQGLWNGVELEPVLFPEKAEEFRCTRELVDSLKDVIEAIRHLPEHVPFAELRERWSQGQRVDQYALADLPSLRGKLGRLLRERSRRALYSGDYHQISRREVLLSERANELERLHQQTWAATASGALEPTPVHARLAQLTLEIAAVLDVTILKAIIGDRKVNDLRARVAMAKGRPAPAGAEGPDALLPLLAEDDLRIFFELLLGNVLRRASLSVSTPAEPEAAPPPAAKPAAPAARPPAAVKPAAKPPAAPAPAPAPTKPPEPPPRPDLFPAFRRAHEVLGELLGASNPHLNAFRMTQRLLEKHARIPGAMFESIHPYLEQIRTKIVPVLRRIAPYQGITDDAVDRLDGYCYDLLHADPALAPLREEIAKKMERLLRFLEAVRAALPNPG